ncbi:Golgi SNAP receptor complex member 2-like [Daphnia pulex]|uniref:Golgi SNAP receptor complex member 2-like n=1 Tax=Daphnia pulex TaxID=6669 RepID=UPI001EE02698|nr:Golgi SNAP receptor complex member 2-like [Daphnia pulex]XP_046440657.1 Golgi SNAP receptor complex member 2-like [Daphnia pulex]
MEVLYHQSQKLVFDVQSLLPHIDRNVGKDAATIERTIQGKLEEITSNIQRLDILVNKELPVRRREARLKVDQLKQDRLMLQNAIHMLQQKRMQREQEEAAREELLTQTFQPNNRETSLYIDQSLQHHTALNGIHRSLDDIWETGTAVLDGLRTQKSVFKKAHRRLLDVTSMLSLSNSVMRMIERRSTQDKYLFYGLAIITCIFILAAFWYFRQ